MVKISGSIVSVSDIVISQSDRKYFEIVVSKENENVTIRVMEEEYSNMIIQKRKSSSLIYKKINLQKMSFHKFQENLSYSTYVEFIGVSSMTGGITPAHYFQGHTSCNFIIKVDGENIPPDNLGVKDILEKLKKPTSSLYRTMFSVHGCIEWIDEFSQYGSGFTARKRVRKCNLCDIFNKDFKILTEVWSEDDKEQRPISELENGHNYRLEFMKVSRTSYSDDKVLTSTSRTKVVAIN